MESKGGGAGKTATSRSRGHGPDRAGRPRMEQPTHPIVQARRVIDWIQR